MWQATINDLSGRRLSMTCLAEEYQRSYRHTIINDLSGRRLPMTLCQHAHIFQEETNFLYKPFTTSYKADTSGVYAPLCQRSLYVVFF